MDKVDQFDKQVKKYEKLRDKFDKFYQFRKHLLQDVRGSVLEIAIGPGFNFDFYTDISKLTALDLSPKMLESAKTKWQNVSPIEGEFIVGALEGIQFPDNTFDSIVSTCSLCAYDDSVEVLNIVSKWCKPDGKIYLLEHGLSDNIVMRFFQHIFEPIHHRLLGCHCNRNIKEIINKSNLEILSLRKPRLYAPIDFLYEVIARPKNK